MRCLTILLMVCGIAVYGEEPDIRSLIEANAGKTVALPDGVYWINEPIFMTADNTVLHGHATIVQTNPDADIIRVENAKGVRIEGLTLTRAEGRQDSTASGVRAENCTRLELSGLHIHNNCSQQGTIYLIKCESSVVRDCEILNYKRIGVDDRTASDLYGYAFRVIDGTGIQVNDTSGLQIVNNRVLEEMLYPTIEMKDLHKLGQLCEGKNPAKKGKLAPTGDYANNWHQGSAITVSSPESTSHVLISGNLIRNAAQGIDMHLDHATCSNNIIDHAFIGLKCMHGARNVIIANNTVSHMDLWGLVMMPGTLAHPAEAAKEGTPARESNYTRGNIIANNVFSDFGRGYERYNWEQQKSGVITLDSGQLPENPVMTDVIIEGNIVYDSAADGELVDGKPQTTPPQYEWAVYIATEPRPQGLVFRNNIFHPGKSGVSNMALED
ncbi:MAG: right-handed parallel beta-helix repeat-containing protein [Candidatus Hydrogenedentes bacterium]|nr:right-handed parallel beta-helix repeat-containing protein [Candidatus Hydrogenedentota bacterium]